MSDQPVFVAVATYPSRTAAEKDLLAVCGVRREGERDHVAAAVLEKGFDGTLEMRRHDSTAKQLPWVDLLLGGAITVLAAPVGIVFLAPVVATSAEWASVGAIVGHFWHHIPRDQLRKMSDLLEAGQAGLVVVAVNHSQEDVAEVLSNAPTKIVTDSAQADFEHDFAKKLGSIFSEPKRRSGREGQSWG